MIDDVCKKINCDVHGPDSKTMNFGFLIMCVKCVQASYKAYAEKHGIKHTIDHDGTVQMEGNVTDAEIKTILLDGINQRKITKAEVPSAMKDDMVKSGLIGDDG